MKKIICFILAIIMVASCFTCFAATETEDAASNTWEYIKIFNGELVKISETTEAYAYDMFAFVYMENGTVYIGVQPANSTNIYLYSVKNVFFTVLLFPILCHTSTYYGALWTSYNNDNVKYGFSNINGMVGYQSGIKWYDDAGEWRDAVRTTLSYTHKTMFDSEFNKWRSSFSN